MAHFGVLAFKGSGHLNPLITLSKELNARGHRVTFFQGAELESTVKRHGIEFYPIGIPAPFDEPPRNTRVGRIRAAVRRVVRDVEFFLREYPPAIQAAGVDTLIMGEISLAGPTVAELLRLPYFVISTSIPHNFGWGAPRTMLRRGSLLDRLEREVLEVSIFRMRGPIRWGLNSLRRRMGFKAIDKIGETHPELAHITQWPRCVEEDHTSLPKNFFYTGPFVEEAAREPVPFPWHRLDDRLLIYASLGTTRKSDPDVFARVAQACRELNVQLVISLGGRRDVSDFSGLGGDPVVVSNAPQLELLKRADVVLTHAGPNTVLEALMQGKPMVALPMRLDQPAVAARLLRLGVAEVLPLANRSVDAIREALAKVLGTESYRQAALKVQAELAGVHGVQRAADIIEERLRSQAPRRWAVNAMTLP